VHVPFCLGKCSYCSFYSIVESGDTASRFGRALLSELRRRAADRRIGTVYIGGGTPTVLDPAFWTEFMHQLETTADTSEILEQTIEANPGTVWPDQLSILRRLGFSRLSIGVQSFSSSELRILGRIHDTRAGAEAVSMARTAGFESICLDLIYGIPRQTRRSWRRSLTKAIKLQPEHISCYELSIDAGTPLSMAFDDGSIKKPSDAIIEDMYYMADEMLEEEGFVHYEVSNFSRGRENQSLHNSSYWDRRPYIGLGPSAHSFDGGRIRTWNVGDLESYLKRIEGGEDAIEESEVLGRTEEALEIIMLGLRRKDGFDLLELERGTGTMLDLDYLHRMEDDGKVEFSGSRVLPTAKGMLFADGDAVDLLQ